MNKSLLLYLICIFSCCAFNSRAQKAAVDYVNMFTGTSNSRAMLGPYAGVPYGMVQLGQTIKIQFGWEVMSILS